jgi:hypothetical protein
VGLFWWSFLDSLIQLTCGMWRGKSELTMHESLQVQFRSPDVSWCFAHLFLYHHPVIKHGELQNLLYLVDFPISMPITIMKFGEFPSYVWLLEDHFCIQFQSFPNCTALQVCPNFWRSSIWRWAAPGEGRQGPAAICATFHLCFLLWESNTPCCSLLFSVFFSMIFPQCWGSIPDYIID